MLIKGTRILFSMEKSILCAKIKVYYYYDCLNCTFMQNIWNFLLVCHQYVEIMNNIIIVNSLNYNMHQVICFQLFHEIL